jgi:hypothetical protein
VPSENETTLTQPRDKIYKRALLAFLFLRLVTSSYKLYGLASSDFERCEPTVEQTERFLYPPCFTLPQAQITAYIHSRSRGCLLQLPGLQDGTGS